MRNFIAIPIDLETTQKLSKKVLALQSAGWAKHIRWFNSENYHLTLQFLGSKLEIEKVNQIVNVMDDWHLNEMLSFKTDIKSIQLFPESHSAHTIVATVNGSTKIQSLISRITETTNLIGLSPTKQDFLPHISLGRITKQVNLNELLIPTEIAYCDNIKLKVDTITLYQSQLTTQAPIYTPLKSIFLKNT